VGSPKSLIKLSFGDALYHEMHAYVPRLVYVVRIMNVNYNA